MREAGVPARGIDSSLESIALCREKGLPAEAADLFDYLRGLGEGDLDGIFCAQVVETGCDSISICDRLECLRADSASREEPEAWHVEYLLRLSVHPESQGNLSSDYFLGVFIFLLVVRLGLAGVGAALTYHVITATSSQESVNPQSYLLNSYFSLNFTDRHGGEHEGWLLLGLRRAPVIILCHGYDSNRSDSCRWEPYCVTTTSMCTSSIFMDPGPRKAPRT